MTVCPNTTSTFAYYSEFSAIAGGWNMILIDNVGRLQAVNRVYASGDATKNCIDRKTIDIQNLSFVVYAIWKHCCTQLFLDQKGEICFSLWLSIEMPCRKALEAFSLASKREYGSWASDCACRPLPFRL